jgi:D-alanine transaminase
MEIAYYQNKFIDVDSPALPIDERGHQFGDGVYEYVRVYDGTPLFLDEHLDRLEKSAAEIKLTLPYRRDEITGIIYEGIKRSSLKEAAVYFQITRGIAPRNHSFPNVKAVFSMTVKEATIFTDEARNKGISVMLKQDERWANCFIKSLNLLPNVLSKQEAIEKGYDEAIFVHEDFVREGTSCNVFIVKDGTLYTPPATRHILHGITRKAVLDCAREYDIPVREQAINTTFFKNCDEAFITSTSIEIMPIYSIEDQTLPKERPVTERLYSAYQSFYKQEV